MGSCDLQKISSLSNAAIFDITCSNEKPKPAEIDAHCRLNKIAFTEPGKIPGVTHVNNCGRPMPVLKVLQSSHCVFNCNYCSFRRDNDKPRDSFSPDEMAKTTVAMSEKGYIEGLFLSSGIAGSVRKTMTDIIDTARILREKYFYPGYIHLKIMPGSSMELIEEAGRFADRLSVNMEAPTELSLRAIAPDKQIDKGIIKQMQAIETLRRAGKINKRVGQVTQFVVGGSDDPGANDIALVQAAHYLYRELNFRRIYYPPFNPVLGTPLESRKPENPLRSYRLYQADFLLSRYGYSPDDIIFEEDGRLDLAMDPKERWARAHPEIYPVEINTAPPWLLKKVPGIGPLTVDRILKARFEGRIRDVEDFLRLGNVGRKTLEWILVNGKMGEIPTRNPRREKSQQLSLFF